MKIQGHELTGPAVEVLVIPRQSGDIVFKAKAVLDYTDFDKLCPLPTAPEILRPGGGKAQDVNDPEYVKALDEWASHKTEWMVLKSLEGTEGLEWETIDYSDPDTWKNYVDEFTKAGFSETEINRLVNTAATACGLNQTKIDEATKRFLAGQAANQLNGSYHSSELSTTPSGDRVSV